MARYTFKLPDIGEGIAEAEIAEWHVAVGDVIEEDITIVDVLTDKAAVDISSPVAGTVVELCGEAGDKVAVGGPLIIFETATAAAAATPDIPPSDPETHPAAGGDDSEASAPTASNSADNAAAAAPVETDRPVLASPAVRKRAKLAGINLQQIAGTGPMGRIRQADLDAALRLGPLTPGPAAGTPAPQQAPQVVPPAQAQSRKVIGLRRKIAEAMTASYQRIPHFSYVEEVDITELLKLRDELNATRGSERAKLSLLPFLGRGLCRVLPQFPSANAVYDDASGTLHESAAVHLGIATQTDQALMVPVVKEAQACSLWELADSIAGVVTKAREGKAGRDELSGSTITITSLGALGGLVSTPIINAPEVAIIGVNKIQDKLVLDGGQLGVRKVMNLSSSFDHRIVDGHQAASLIQALKRVLEHPALLFADL